MTAKNPTIAGPIGGGIKTSTTPNCTPQITVRGDLILSSNNNAQLLESNISKSGEELRLMQPTVAGLLPAQASNDFAHHLMQNNHLTHNINNNNNNNSTLGANTSQLAGVGMEAMQSMDWLFKKERIYLLAQFWQQVGSTSNYIGEVRKICETKSISILFQ